MHSLSTGDLVLFACKNSEWTLFDSMIRFFTGSSYVHAGMILVDPPFHKVSKGIYLWESGWESSPDPQNGLRRLGVRITPISKIDISSSHIYIRKCTKKIKESELISVNTDVYLKPYDLCLSDWLLASLRLDKKPQKTDRFWCSAFVAFVLTRIGFLEYTTDWSIVRPCDLSSESSYLDWTQPSYDKDTYISQSEWKELISK